MKQMKGFIILLSAATLLASCQLKEQASNSDTNKSTGGDPIILSEQDRQDSWQQLTDYYNVHAQIVEQFNQVQGLEMETDTKITWRGQSQDHSQKSQEIYQDGTLKAYLVDVTRSNKPEGVAESYYFDGENRYQKVGQEAWQKNPSTASQPAIYLNLMRFLLEDEAVWQITEEEGQLTINKELTDPGMQSQIMNFLNLPFFVSGNAIPQILLTYKLDNESYQVSEISVNLLIKDVKETYQVQLLAQPTYYSNPAPLEVDLENDTGQKQVLVASDLDIFERSNQPQAYYYYEARVIDRNQAQDQEYLIGYNKLSDQNQMTFKIELDGDQLNQVSAFQDGKQMTSLSDGGYEIILGEMPDYYHFYSQIFSDRYEDLESLEEADNDEDQIYRLQLDSSNQLTEFAPGLSVEDMIQSRADYALDFRLDPQTKQLQGVDLWRQSQDQNNPDNGISIDFTQFNQSWNNVAGYHLTTRAWQDFFEADTQVLENQAIRVEASETDAANSENISLPSQYGDLALQLIEHVNQVSDVSLDTAVTITWQDQSLSMDQVSYEHYNELVLDQSFADTTFVQGEQSLTERLTYNAADDTFYRQLGAGQWQAYEGYSPQVFYLSLSTLLLEQTSNWELVEEAGVSTIEVDWQAEDYVTNLAPYLPLPLELSPQAQVSGKLRASLDDDQSIIGGVDLSLDIQDLGQTYQVELETDFTYNDQNNETVDLEAPVSLNWESDETLDRVQLANPTDVYHYYESSFVDSVDPAAVKSYLFVHNQLAGIDQIIFKASLENDNLQDLQVDLLDQSIFIQGDQLSEGLADTTDYYAHFVDLFLQQFDELMLLEAGPSASSRRYRYYTDDFATLANQVAGLDVSSFEGEGNIYGIDFHLNQETYMLESVQVWSVTPDQEAIENYYAFFFQQFNNRGSNVLAANLNDQAWAALSTDSDLNLQVSDESLEDSGAEE